MPCPERPVAGNTGLAGRVLSLNFAGNLGVLSTNSVTGGVWELILNRKGTVVSSPDGERPESVEGLFIDSSKR